MWLSSSVIHDFNENTTGNDVDIDGDGLSYEIIAGNIGNYAVIDPSSGVVTVGPNPPTESSYNLTVRTTDGMTTDTATLVITIVATNLPPQMSSYSVNIPETVANSTVVVDLNDASGGDTDEDGDPLTYSIVGGNSNGLVAINSSTGVITIDDNTQIDRPNNPVAEIEVESSDGTLTDRNTVYINFTSTNTQSWQNIEIPSSFPAFKARCGRDNPIQKANGALHATVSSKAAFLTALDSCPPGGKIEITSGTYSDWGVMNIRKDVQIVSQSGRGAVFSGLQSWNMFGPNSMHERITFDNCQPVRASNFYSIVEPRGANNGLYDCNMVNCDNGISVRIGYDAQNTELAYNYFKNPGILDVMQQQLNPVRHGNGPWTKGGYIHHNDFDEKPKDKPNGLEALMLGYGSSTGPESSGMNAYHPFDDFIDMIVSHNRFYNMSADSENPSLKASRILYMHNYSEYVNVNTTTRWEGRMATKCILIDNITIGADAFSATWSGEDNVMVYNLAIRAGLTASQASQAVELHSWETDPRTPLDIHSRYWAADRLQLQRNFFVNYGGLIRVQHHLGGFQRGTEGASIEENFLCNTPDTYRDDGGKVPENVFRANNTWQNNISMPRQSGGLFAAASAQADLFGPVAVIQPGLQLTEIPPPSYLGELNIT